MPFIMAKVNQKITAQQKYQLKSGLGQAIGFVPGKSEEVLMVGIEDQYDLYLHGDDRVNLAYISVAIYGIPHHEGYVNLNLAITKLFYEVLKIHPENIFIDYADIRAWGNSGYFIDGKGVHVPDKNASSSFDF
ncbi:hypothetical protein [Lactiplantibacillus plantarum]|uniref:Uncharacterized protein n=1 Tax=Lactiplantibacillus plantarum (strain ATCC BAA-793 / NCIMB 8826 / WCFS1) TaxID=220668 RepID=F9UNB3_LACPL|nr:hypothetical protein [Lactiplantibacillus plantarum]AUS73698.1 hypothetical protein C1T23_03047 [Lactiplantibacillus plantarum]KZU66104.1 hypothetical protein Nizo2814_1243 [Lactiplantibacillus plantarum]MCG0662892.1 hypothetical protein [Lactiplantibacillus plantarum]MCJ2382945.1 hypothetical protein [Lactiplantibacillus plantarum]MCS6157153.1 hypothetical protein [Lactiplantibacillus plantarum]